LITAGYLGTVPSIGTPAALRSGTIVLTFGRTTTDRTLRLTAGAAGGLTHLAAGSLLLQLGGRRQERLVWDDAILTADGSSIEAQIRRDNFDIRTTVTAAPDAQGFDIETVLTARSELSVISLWHRFSFPPGADHEPGRPLDFAWIPNLCSRRDDIAGEHTFRSPCLIARQGHMQVALVPHLRHSLFAGPLRHALSFRLEGKEGPTLGFGRLDHVPHGHVYYRPTGRAAVLLPGEELRLAFTLLADAAADEHGYQKVVRFIWKRWAEPTFTGGFLPQVLPFDEYAREGFTSTLERYGLWREFTIDGRKAGGTCIRSVRPGLEVGSAPRPRDTAAKVITHYLLTSTLSLRERARMLASGVKGIHPHIWYSVFFNGLRTAFGMEWYARRWNDEGLAGKARMMRELALAAPAPQGIPASVFTADPQRPRWVRGMRLAWYYLSDYCTPNAAWTGCWMLHHLRHLETDNLFLDRCRALGDFLVRAQLPSGAIPTWVRVGRDGSIRPVPPLVESATSAAAGMFLAMLHEFSRDPRHLEAAKRIADFLIDRVFPANAWQDPELFFSCSEKKVGWCDAWTGIPPQSTFSYAWTAELMRLLYLATRDDRYRDHGRAVIDLLLLYQQVWNAPFIGFDTRGGFGVMNTDAEWSDARQAQFGTLLMDWYDVTGEPELFHRGVAALRSSFTLMYLEEHRTLAPKNTRPMGPNDRGAMPENYGHAGFDAKIQGEVMPDWGVGTAASSAALAQARWGDLYLDVHRGAAFGIDGCRVTRASVGADRADLDIETLPRGPRRMPLTMKASGIAAPRYSLRVNGRDLGTHDRADLERGMTMEAT
jgi:hypothetical protein